MGRARRVFAAAIALSLLAHLALMGTAAQWWTMPRDEVPFPLEARLAPVPKAAALPETPHRLPARPEPEAAASPAPSPVPSAPESTPTPTPTPAPEPAPPQPGAIQPPADMPVRAPVVAAEPAPIEPPGGPRRSVRALPARLKLVYGVLAGDEGFNLGQATYTWQAQGERYRLESVAEAKGLAALFMSGRIVQTSEGRIGTGGLVPEQFAQSQNGRRRDTARFDWEAGQLVTTRGAEALREGTQDLLSFAFHLAMTVAEGDEGWILPVTNGRKLKGYRFAVLGREQIEIGGQLLDTLHVQGTRAFEGSLDVWLAPAWHWLPVRIRTQDQQGKVLLLNLTQP